MHKVVDKSFVEACLNNVTPDERLGQRARQLRSEASTEFYDLANPSIKDEEWRFTDLSSIYKKKFSPAKLNQKDNHIAKRFFRDDAGHRLVFINGFFCKDASVISNNSEGSFYIGTLQESFNVCDRVVKQKLGRISSKKNDFFVCLNTSNLNEGAVIQVCENVSIERPVHILWISTGENFCSNPRLFVNLENNSSASIVEEFVSFSSKENLTNIVSEISVGEYGRLSHGRVQREDTSSFNIGTYGVQLSRGAHYRKCSVDTGSRISRLNVNIEQVGKDVNCEFDGLSILNKNQLGDLHSKIFHNESNGKSRQVYKTILGGASKAVFNGQIHVARDGHMTDASQSNKNLLLTQKGRVDTKPQLEIFADEVKCSHGATVGRLDDDEMFYLQSRGISKDMAQKLLIYGFAAEIIQRLEIASLSRELINQILEQTESENIL